MEHSTSAQEIPIVEQFLSIWEKRAEATLTTEYYRMRRYMQNYAERREFCLQYAKINGIKDAKDVFDRFGANHDRYQAGFSDFPFFVLELKNHHKNWSSKLKTIIQREKRKKRKDFINRVTRFTGDLSDLTKLRCNEAGELYGTISGRSGTVEVITVSAGGHGLQCLHTRIMLKALEQGARP